METPFPPPPSRTWPAISWPSPPPTAALRCPGPRVRLKLLRPITSQPLSQLIRRNPSASFSASHLKPLSSPPIARRSAALTALPAHAFSISSSFSRPLPHRSTANCARAPDSRSSGVRAHSSPIPQRKASRCAVSVQPRPADRSLFSTISPSTTPTEAGFTGRNCRSFRSTRLKWCAAVRPISTGRAPSAA